MKKYIVAIDYDYYLARDKEQAVELLSIQVLKREYIGTKEIYSPKDVNPAVYAIDEENIRPVTKEEKENKELEDAKTHAQWTKKENADLKKQIEELKCQISVLTKEKEEKGE